MVYVNQVATALPQHAVPTAQLGQAMAQLAALPSQQARLLQAALQRTGIAQRHSVLPDFGPGPAQLYHPGPEPHVGQRLALYLPLATQLAQQAVAALGPVQQPSHLVVASCTGMAAPGLDLSLAQALGLPGSTPRYAVTFMGCHAALHALRLASHIVASTPGARVLVVCVELCSLHYHYTTDRDSLAASALFGDGAAAALLSSQPGPLSLGSFHTATVPAQASDMGWSIGPQGFLMQLSSYVPQLLGAALPQLLAQVLPPHSPGEKGGQRVVHVVHPGGPRVLEAYAQAAGIALDELEHSAQVLAQCGNMSSPTVLFALQRWLQGWGGGQQPLFMAAFGPGLTIEAANLMAQA